MISWTTGGPNVPWWIGVQKTLYVHCVLILFIMNCVDKSGKCEVENGEARVW